MEERRDGHGHDDEVGVRPREHERTRGRARPHPASIVDEQNGGKKKEERERLAQRDGVVREQRRIHGGDGASRETRDPPGDPLCDGKDEDNDCGTEQDIREPRSPKPIRQEGGWDEGERIQRRTERRRMQLELREHQRVAIAVRHGSRQADVLISIGDRGP